MIDDLNSIDNHKSSILPYLAARFLMVSFLKIIAGPAAAALCYILLQWLQPDEQVSRMACIAAWMALWWLLESVPMAVTSLLPVFLFPLAGIMSTDKIAPFYMNDVLMLFIGGFLLAFAMERWHLHRRIALRIISFIGTDYHKILFGLMLATYLISMWVSNTATTLMMMPTAMAVIARIEEMTGQRNNKIGVAMLLGIAYSASIGGTATLVGTPPNMIFLSQFKASFPNEAPVSFLQWSLFGIPFSFAYLLICYALLVKLNMKEKMVAEPHHHGIFKKELDSLGKMTFEEKMVTLLFLVMTLLWFTRADLPIGSITIRGWSSFLPHPDFFQDGTVAIFIATLLFVIPSKSKQGEMLMDWESAKKLPFSIILLFGGGFALAKGFAASGLADWLGAQMQGIGALPDFVIILLVCTFMTYLSEVASNVAITQLMLPVLAAVAVAADIPPLLLMIPATFAASFGFMLPVATAPNTIIFTGEKLTVKDMLRAGIWLDILGIIWLTLAMNIFGRWVFGV